MCVCVFYHIHIRTLCLGTSSDAALSAILQAVSSSHVTGDLFSKFLLKKECKNEFSGHFKSWNNGRENDPDLKESGMVTQALVFASKDMTTQSTHQSGGEEVVPRGSCPEEGRSRSRRGTHCPRLATTPQVVE